MVKHTGKQHTVPPIMAATAAVASNSCGILCNVVWAKAITDTTPAAATSRPTIARTLGATSQSECTTVRI